MQNMETGAILRLNAAEIIRFVADETLASLSKWPEHELIRIGWYDSGAVARLYELSSAGLWTARTDPSGRVQEANSSTISNYNTYSYRSSVLAQHPTISGYVGSGGGGESNYAKRFAVKACTLANGAVSDQELVAALAGYYGVVRILGIYSSAAINGDTVTLNFEDEDDTDLYGAPADISASCTATAFTTDLDGLTMSQATQTDEKALECDLDTGGGAGDNGKVIYIAYEYWYET